MSTNKKRVQANLDPELVEQTNKILKELGLNSTTAITLFYKEVVKTRSIPFDISLKI